MVKKLTLPDQRHLDAAEGWLGLGDHLAANEELDQISPVLRAYPKVLQVRYEVYAQAGRWEACVDIAAALVTSNPGMSFGWVHRSFALHELKRTEEAHDLLLPAVKRFPGHWVTPYNLACYCSQLKRFEEATDWFRKAMLIDGETVKREAIDDPDLLPLWDSRSGAMWKRE
jgi:tetratricopeptide (TPR) repeat protein